MRFCYHPLKDHFVQCNSWKDPAWTDVKSIRDGIGSEEKENRELVFGKNLIDIKQKTIPQLLVDEVCSLFLRTHSYLTSSAGISPILCFPDCKSFPLVG
jgi:cation-transporting ATPase 13A3/4/5